MNQILNWLPVLTSEKVGAVSIVEDEGQYSIGFTSKKLGVVEVSTTSRDDGKAYVSIKGRILLMEASEFDSFILRIAYAQTSEIQDIFDKKFPIKAEIDIDN